VAVVRAPTSAAELAAAAEIDPAADIAAGEQQAATRSRDDATTFTPRRKYGPPTRTIYKAQLRRGLRNICTECKRSQTVGSNASMCRVLRQPPKPAQVSRSYRGLPGYFQEYLWGHRLVWLCHCHALLYVCDVITCTCILREAPFGAELGEFLVGSSRGVAICGVVRACTLQGREHCAGGGVRRQNVAREAHGGFKSLLASRLRPLSSKATHPPNDRSLHIRTPAPAPGRVSPLHNRAGGGGGPVRVTART